MTSPVKVCCPVHGMVPLTAEQYRLQLDRPETPWFCPQCLATAVLVPDAVGTTRDDAADPQPETCDWSWDNRNRTGRDHTCKRAVGHGGPHLCNCGASDDVPVPTLPPVPRPGPPFCCETWAGATPGDDHLHRCRRAANHEGRCVCGDCHRVRSPAVLVATQRHTVEEHRQRHADLHRAFEELLSDYLTQNPKAYPSKTPLLDLLRWSHEQAIRPTEPPG